MPTYSQQRLEEKIIRAVSLLIVQREIKNPKISTLVSPVHVDLAADNSAATIYIAGFTDNEVLDKSVEGLNESKSFIQSRLAGFLRTKKTPVLKFEKDRSIEESEKINDLIEAVKHDD